MTVSYMGSAGSSGPTERFNATKGGLACFVSLPGPAASMEEFKMVSRENIGQDTRGGLPGPWLSYLIGVTGILSNKVLTG